MDEGKKRYLDRYVASRMIPDTLDIDISDILDFFEKEPKYWDHRLRFVETYIRIMRHVHPEKGWRIAETGALSGTSEYLRTRGHNVTDLKGDFRSRIEAEDASVDFLISMEVLEHIKDQDSQSFDDLVLFNFSGVNTFISEMWRVLRPGGFLAVTTPNACSLYALTQLLAYEPPVIWSPHVKEYAPSEVIGRCEERGFKNLFWDTMFVLFHLDENQPKLLREMFTDRGASAENRGDVTFFLFQKLSA